MKIYDRFLCDADTGPNHLVAHNAIFARDRHKFSYTDNLDEADIVCVISSFNQSSETYSKLKPNQILLELDNLFHVDHGSGIDLLDDLHNKLQNKNIPTKKIIIAHKNQFIKDKKYLYYDILFQREKLYCLDYSDDIDLDKQIWTLYCDKGIYDLTDINFPYQRSKNILCPSRIYKFNSDNYHERMNYRIKLRDFLYKNNFGRGYISESNNGAIFNPNTLNPYVLERLLNQRGGFWYPSSNVYYNNTYVSVYGETIANYCNVMCATEKTFDPLIKGHFILPFARPFFIKQLKDYYGFKFPNWIDYSYDDIINNDERFEQYLKSVKNIINLSFEDLHKLAITDTEILHHNRNVFKNAIAESFYDKLVDCINYNFNMQ